MFTAEAGQRRGGLTVPVEGGATFKAHRLLYHSILGLRGTGSRSPSLSPLLPARPEEEPALFSAAHVFDASSRPCTVCRHQPHRASQTTAPLRTRPRPAMHLLSLQSSRERGGKRGGYLPRLARAVDLATVRACQHAHMSLQCCA